MCTLKMLLPKDPILGAYLKMISRKTREETMKGQPQAKKWDPRRKNYQFLDGNCKKFKKATSADGAERKNKEFLKLALSLVS